MLIVPVLLALLPTQAGVAAEDALMAPQQMRVPSFGETDVARNAALITIEQPTAVAVVTFDGATEVATPATLEVVEGITIARLPLQPALTDVTVRISFGGGFSEDMSWTTGNALIDGPAAPAEVARAEVVSPFLENPHVEIEIAPEQNLAAAVLSVVDGDQRTRLSTSVTWGPGAGLSFSDWSYQGGTRDYDVVAIDRAGNVAEATPVTVSPVGCAATPAGSVGALALALLAMRRRYTRRSWASSIAG